MILPFLPRPLQTDAAVLLSAATDGTPDALSQFGLAGAVIAPVLGAGAWLFRRTIAANDATNAARITELAADRDYHRTRADRNEARANDIQERVLPVLLASAETNREVIAAVRDLGRGAR